MEPTHPETTLGSHFPEKINNQPEISTKLTLIEQSDISAMTNLMLIQVPLLFGQIRVRNLSEICYDDLTTQRQSETPRKNWWLTPLEEPEVVDDDALTNFAKTTDVFDDKLHCIGCAKTFSKKFHLQRHEQTSECCGGSPKVKTSRWKCPTCLTTFSRNEHFKRHLASGSCNEKRNVVNGCFNDAEEKKVKKSFTIMDWLNRGPAVGKAGQKRKLDTEI